MFEKKIIWCFYGQDSSNRSNLEITFIGVLKTIPELFDKLKLIKKQLTIHIYITN
ncbi:MAG: hypothetical protein FWF27_03605 [Candidatus Bathyarchaeota archaeon]|nr:hypothetical protein [Candidatus Termiticorpusculum sp.]